MYSKERIPGRENCLRKEKNSKKSRQLQEMVTAVWWCAVTHGAAYGYCEADTQMAGHVDPGEALQGQEEEFGQIEETLIFSFNSLWVNQ